MADEQRRVRRYAGGRRTVYRDRSSSQGALFIRALEPCPPLSGLPAAVAPNHCRKGDERGGPPGQDELHQPLPPFRGRPEGRGLGPTTQPPLGCRGTMTGVPGERRGLHGPHRTLRAGSWRRDSILSRTLQSSGGSVREKLGVAARGAARRAVTKLEQKSNTTKASATTSRWESHRPSGTVGFSSGQAVTSNYVHASPYSRQRCQACAGGKSFSELCPHGAL